MTFNYNIRDTVKKYHDITVYEERDEHGEIVDNYWCANENKLGLSIPAKYMGNKWCAIDRLKNIGDTMNITMTHTLERII